MSFSNFIDLCSDEETEEAVVGDVKPVLSSNCLQVKIDDMIGNDLSKLEGHPIKQELEESRSSNSGSCFTDQGSSSASGFCRNSASPDSPIPLCRQFWKSGDYEPGQALATVSQNGRNCLRIHPKFLHSNATSHKWAFGAIAELLDNAVDEVPNGATFVVIDKFTNPRNGNPALLIQDDGGGMDPESLRRCMSFGFSDKQAESSIGQYGNGFKTSTMRLAADVIVFSRAIKNRILTQSVGLLSYTFLRQTGCEDIVVPTVDYELDPLTGLTGRIFRHGLKQFSSNLMMLLKWSPFASEVELMEQFNDIGRHGTKIILFNLWYNDDGNMELDFESDLEDIMISGAHKSVQKNSIENVLTQKNIATRLHYSLRAYISVLYLRIPDNFRIILRGEVVEPRFIVNDLIYRECVMYRPQVGGIIEAAVVTTIGFVEGAPNVNVHGFNIYHKNRLILPFLRVANNSYGKGRGVVGILEANFIKPTHDKQDFEKSTLYQKLENRLKEMTYEYWDLHCHLVGYTSKKKPTLRAPIQQMPQLTTASCVQQVNKKCSSTTPPQASLTTNISACSQFISAIGAPTNSSPGQFTASIVDSQTRLPVKRKRESHIAATEASKQLTLSEVTGHGSNPMTQLCHGAEQKQLNEIRTMILENKKLHEQCLQSENTEKQLILKAQQLRSELQEAQQLYDKLLIEFKAMGEVKMEK